MIDKDTHFEMAVEGDTRGIIVATQKSLVVSIQQVLQDLKNQHPNAPGLTWEQIDFLLERFKNREPTIIKQEYTT